MLSRRAIRGESFHRLLLLRNGNLTQSTRQHPGSHLRQVVVVRCHSTSASSTTAATSKQQDDEKTHPTTTPTSFDLEKVRQELFHNWMTAQSKSPQGLATTARYCCFTYHDAMRTYQDPKSDWHWLDREMSSNLAGETGAIAIYTGALAAMQLRPSAYTMDAIEFCHAHQGNELIHLQYFQSIVPPGKHTKLLPLWRLAGWTLGFSSTLVGGTRGLYVTVEAVETFVEEHFQEQIVPLRQEGKSPELVQLLERCCEDEVHHKEDAARRLLDLNKEAANLLNNDDDNLLVSGWWVQPWTQIVQTGSAWAAEVARRV